MLNSLLLYFGDVQREGRFVTSRMRLRVILNILAVFFLALAFLSAVVGGCVVLAHSIGAGPAALTVAIGSLAVAVFIYIWLRMLDRPHRITTLRTPIVVGSPVAAITATQVATQAALSTVLRRRPYLTLFASAALGYLATRTSMRK